MCGDGSFANIGRVYLRYSVVSAQYVVVVSTSFARWDLPIPSLALYSVLLIVGLRQLAAAQPASPAQWLYPAGSSTALPIQGVPSLPQSLDSLTVKWRVDAIAGNTSIVVADIAPTAPLDSGTQYSPLELAAVVGGKLVLVDARGKLRNTTHLPPFAHAISVVIDSSLLPAALGSRLPSILFLQTAERATSPDSFAVAYIAGYDTAADSIALLTRLTYDLRPYAPNLAAWVRPIFAMPSTNGMAVYSVLGTTAPRIDSSNAGVPYFRGLAVTRITPGLLGGGSFPIPDAGDNPSERIPVAPHVGLTQPSLVAFSPAVWTCLLPSTPSNDSTVITTASGSRTIGTEATLLCALFANGLLGERFQASQLDTILSAPRAKPIVTPYWVELHDGTRLGHYILLAESYLGRDGSFGRAQLHLLTEDGTPITSPRNGQNPPFRGGRDRGWAIGIGNLDGNANNELLPYYPNNPGAEIVLTESSRDVAVASSRLMVLRYRSGTAVPKPSPAGAVLAPLDTIVTFPITGWLAAVADLDSAADGKAEVLLADGSDLLVLRLRDYADPRFRMGAPFDTAFLWHAPGEAITNVAVADPDGDGKLDIIVTTTNATYLLGAIPAGALRIVTPRDTTGSALTVCLHDTIVLRWRFFYAGERRYSIAFRSSSGSHRLLVRDTLLRGDTITVHIPAATLRNEQGRLVVWLSSDSTIRDESSDIAISNSSVQIDTSTLQTSYRAGERIIIAGRTECVDTLQFFASLDSGLSWQPLRASSTIGSGRFIAALDLPCVPFAPLGNADTTLIVRVRGISAADTTDSDALPMRLLPNSIALDISSNQPSFCCEYQVMATPAAVPCSTAIVFVRYGSGEPWVLVDSTDGAPVTVRGRGGSSDTIYLRWACRGSCIRTDTVLLQSPLRLITAVAPNPVQRGQEVCRILTTPRSTTAVTIRIFDASDRIVRTLVHEQIRLSQQMYCDIWDCRSDSGELVPPGVYYVLARSNDGWEAFEAVYVR